MATMYVNTRALNFRSEPRVAADTHIGVVHLGQKLDDVEDAAVGWASCSAVIDGESTSGFVSKHFLRPSLSENRERLVASVHREWMRFERGAGKEHRAPYSGFVGEMWQALGIPLDGTDRGIPWSAAAISFMVRHAGPAYQSFRFAAAHSKFIHHAIQARFDEDRTVPFWGFRLDEVQPQIGDILCRDNPNVAPSIDFDAARNTDSYHSHTDVVMHLDPDSATIVAIGGNLSHSVRITKYGLTDTGYAADSRHTFALLRNITDER
ncbi:MAG: DUF2272 domain-containing protein [Myxococcales bacterium]|nr:DUF2272 domain-containing protein [Myxococcales bacterium]